MLLVYSEVPSGIVVDAQDGFTPPKMKPGPRANHVLLSAIVVLGSEEEMETSS